jgi:hypothetical protein
LKRLKTDRYRDRYLRWHATYEKRATTELLKVFKGWVGNLELSGRPNQWGIQMDSQFLEDDLIKAYIKIYTEIGLVHGRRIGNLANRQQKDFNPDFFKEFYQRYIALYLQQAGMGRIYDIRNTFIEYLSGLLQTRAVQGIFGDAPDPSRVATWIQEQARNRSFYRWQALRIARTESTAASNLGGLKAVQDSGYVMDKIWVSAQDARTRRQPEDWYDHYHMNGKSVRADAKFEMVGKNGVDELEYPGDPKGHPANTINFRCTLVYKPRKRDGRLVRQ